MPEEASQIYDTHLNDAFAHIDRETSVRGHEVTDLGTETLATSQSVFNGCCFPDLLKTPTSCSVRVFVWVLEQSPMPE